jgi:integrase
MTSHSLRHTYISLRVALGHDPATIAQDAGHADMAVVGCRVRIAARLSTALLTTRTAGDR